MDSFVLTQTLPTREVTEVLNDICKWCDKTTIFFPVGGDRVLIAKLSSEGTNTIEWEILCFPRLLCTSE